VSTPGTATALVVLAHPEPSSFAAALAHTAADALLTAGWDVQLVDLYQEGFDPVLSAADFSDRLIAGRPTCWCSSRRCGGSRCPPC
jgi:putative NADPH-quinone reductase